MSIICCDIYDGCADDSAGPIYWNGDEAYYNTYYLKRGRKCPSCGSMIRPGDRAYAIPRWRNPTDFELLEGLQPEFEPVEVVPGWLCEGCGDLHVSMLEAGYCADSYGNLLADWKAFKASGEVCSND